MRAKPTLTFYHPGYGSVYGNNTAYIHQLSSQSFPVPRIINIVPDKISTTSVPTVLFDNAALINPNTFLVVLSGANGVIGYGFDEIMQFHYTADAEI